MEPSTYQMDFGFGGMDWAADSSSLVKETGIHVKDASCCKEYAVNEDANSKYRPYMEDTYSCNDNFAGDVTCGLFGVYDGHGGSTVSDYLKDRVHEEIGDRIKSDNPSDLVSTLEDAFEKIDGEVKAIDSEQCGSTA